MAISDKIRLFLRNVFKRPEERVKELSRSEGLIEKTGFTIYGYDIDLISMLQIDYDLEGRFQDYLEMDEFPEISSALDIIADDVTAPDEDGVILRVVSETPGIKEEIQHLIKKLKLEDEIWEMTRSLCKFGNEYEEIVYSDKGVEGLIYLPPITMRRIENRKGVLIGFVQSFTKDFAILPEQVEAIIAQGDPTKYIQGNKIIFEPWEVAHARYRARDRRSLYGYSVVEPARWIWKRLLILEDAVLIYRLTRAADRWIVYVNVGDLPITQAEAYVRKVMSMMKRKKVIDPVTGKLTERFNPLCVTGDTKVPLIDGRVLSVVELVKEYEEGKENWVYSVDPQTLEIKVGKIVWAGKTRLNAQLVEVGLNNGKTLRVTPDHKFMLRDGRYVEAKNLRVGDSLMPLKRLITSKKKGWLYDGYEVVYNPSDGKYVYTHKIVRDIVIKNPFISIEKLVETINTNEAYLKVLKDTNSRNIKKVHRHLLLKMFRKNGYNGFKDFKEKIVVNHKVTYVKFLDEREDTYCITVEPWGNFGVEAGVILKNSLDEDIFIPVRGDKESVRIETLGGMGYVATEDLEYFRNKLFSALKVPKAYLGYEEALSGRATLSQEDLRFARTIMRIQNIMSAFIKKICDVHLAIKNINPADVDYDIFFNIPSTAFEMAKIEIETARIDLANAFSDWVSRRWIYSKVFGFSEQEIETILKQKAEEEGGGAEESFTPIGKTYLTEKSPLRRRQYKNIKIDNIEKYLDEGNKDLEKKLEDNFEKLIKSNQRLYNKLVETYEFMRELRESLQKMLLEKRR